MRIYLIAILGLILLSVTIMPRTQVSAVRVDFGKQLYASGEIIVKLRETASEPSPGVQDERLLTLARLSGESITQTPARLVEPITLSSDNGRIENIIRSRGLDRIFVMRLSPGADIESVLERLRADSAVEYAEPNYRVEPGEVIPDDPRFYEQWGLRNFGWQIDGYNATENADIKASEAWEITTGSPDIIVAVTDTGIDKNHPDLADNIYRNPGEVAGNGVDDDRNGYIDDVNGYNVADQNSDTSDIVGHGTEMAGIIAARLNNQVGIGGICQSKLLPVRFFKRTGPFPDDVEATVADAARALIYSVAAGASVINASWRTFLTPDDVTETEALALRDAVGATFDAGTLLVCIAGNDGFDNDFSAVYPGRYQMANQIVVAATDFNDSIWRLPWEPYTIFSGYGQRTVHLAAPGVSVFTTLAHGTCVSCSNSESPSDWYARINGTSASAAFVSGVAALVKSRYPDENGIVIRRRILQSVDVKEGLRGYVSTGGRLNALGALLAQVTITPPVLNKVEYKKKKLFIEAEALQEGAIALVGGSSYAIERKDASSSTLIARVPKKSLPSGRAVEVRLRNPDGGTSRALTVTR